MGMSRIGRGMDLASDVINGYNLHSSSKERAGREQGLVLEAGFLKALEVLCTRKTPICDSHLRTSSNATSKTRSFSIR